MQKTRCCSSGEAEIKGYDVGVEARISGSLVLRGAVTGLSFDLPAGATPLRSRPRFRATTSAVYQVTPQLTASVFGSWVGRVFDSSVPTAGVTLSPYLVVDAAVSYLIGNARVVLALDNALDRDYQQFVGFPARGRRARVELSIDL